MDKKQLLLSILILLFVYGCATISISGTFGSGSPDISATVEVPIKSSQKEVHTDFGTLRRGMTQNEVKDILGEPKFISKAYDNFQFYWYQFNDNRRIFVYFMDGKVTDVVEKKGATSGNT